MRLAEPYPAEGKAATTLIDKDVVDIRLDVSLILYLEPYLEGMAGLYIDSAGQVHFAQEGDAAAKPTMGTQAGMLRVGCVELPHVVAPCIGYGEANASRQLLDLRLHPVVKSR